MSLDNTAPHKAPLEELVRRLTETEAAIREILGSEVDAVIDPVDGAPILLRRSQAELVRLRSQLEQLVQERTAALQHANEELWAANKELSALNEELATTEEMLRQQNAELAAAHQVIDQERARYKTLFDLAPDGYLVTDATAVIREANHAAGALLGEPPDRLSGRRLSDFVFDADRRLLQEQIHRIRLDQRWQSWRWELRLQPAVGPAFHADITAAPAHSGDGQPAGIRWLVRDITERKRAEAALVASEERFRLVADFNYDWEYWTGPDEQYIYVSPSVERITGYRPAEFFDDPGLMLRLIHPDDRSVWQQHLHAGQQRHDPGQLELRIISRAGDERRIGHVCRSVYRDDGTWLGTRVSNRDITEQVLAAQRLRDSEQKLRALFEILPVGLAVLDAQGNVVHQNQALGTILDLSAAGLRQGAYRARRYLRSDGSPLSLEDMPSRWVLRQQRAIHGAEIGVVKEDGETIWTHVSAAPLPFDDWRVLVATVDETEQVRARHRIAEISAEARRRAEELNTVFGAIADGVVVVDARCIAVKVNPALIELCAGDPVGTSWSSYVVALAARDAAGQLLAPGDLPVSRALTGETVRGHRFTISNRAGQDRTLLASSAPLSHGDEVIGAVAVWHDITRIEQAERARDHLVAILEESPELVSTATLEGIILYYNRAARRMLGVPDDADPASFTIPHGLPPWAADVIAREAIPTALREGLWTGRTALLSHDGTEVPIAQIVLAHRGPDGEVQYLSSIGRDVRREEAMMAQLEAERTRLKTILDNAPAGVVVTDNQARVLFTNPAADRLYTRPVPYGQEYASHASLQLCDADGNPYDPRHLPLTRSALDGESFHDLEMSIVWPDGQRRHLLVNVAPILPAPRQIAGAVAVFQDVTERREMQAALRRAHDELEERVIERTLSLRESEERFRQLAEHIEDVFWLFDPATGTFLYVSPAYETLLGRTAAEIYQRPQAASTPRALLDAVHPDDRAGVVRLFDGVDEALEHEFRLHHADGSERWLRTRVFPVRDAGGRTYRVAGVTSDVTQQKLAQLAMIKTERLSMAGQMAASLAHEINNPLQGATGCLELMREAIEDGYDPSHYVDVAYEALSRAGRTVSQLRALHRGPAVEEKETTGINDLVAESLVLMRKKAAAQDVDLVWEPGSDLAPLPLMRDGMHQVFLNLVLNALDAMPGGGRLEVRTEAVQRPLGVRVIFADTGPGLAPDVLAHLFEPFRTTKPEGTGLGLFVSQNTVERHGGRIEVDSTDQGATFTVWLPA